MQTMADTATLTVRLPTEIEARLDRLAKTTSISKSRLAADAIVAYLDEQEHQLERIREGLADAEAGRVVLMARSHAGSILGDRRMSCRRRSAADLDAPRDLGCGRNPRLYRS
jgi:predicted transcriptional regulator